MKMSLRFLSAVAFALALVGVTTGFVSYAAGPKVTICHSTGSDKNPFNAIVVDLSSGDLHPHLDSNGNPNGGAHANDFLLQGEQTEEDCAKNAPGK